MSSKKKFNNKRYHCKITLSKEKVNNMIENDIVLCDDDFFTLNEICDKTKLSYNCVTDIYRKKYNKFIDQPMTPLIQIYKINDKREKM